jgi:hypothetical protein
MGWAIVKVSNSKPLSRAKGRDFWGNSHERSFHRSREAVFLGFAARRQISADGSIIVFKIVQFWTETPAESVYVKLREEILELLNKSRLVQDRIAIGR